MNNQPAAIEAEVAFLNDEWRDRADTPRIYSRESRHANTTRRLVTIHNARLRQAAGDLDLDGSGFVIVNHPTSFQDYRNQQSVRDVYFPEMEQVMRSLTGADRIFSFPFFQVRSRDPEHFFDAYSLYMHCDFSPDRVPGFVRSVLEQHKVVDEYPLEEWDFALYNLWRPIGAPVQKDPLVFGDASTIEPEDILDYLVSAEGDRARAAMPLFNEQQRLYYVPEIRPDEVLILKQLDSREGHAMVCPHTSFADPSSPPDAPERKSIDIRFMCAFRKKR